MTTQTIEVEGLPEGWSPLRYGWPKKNIDYIFDGLGVKLFLGKEDHAMLIVEKIQQRRIVLEETGEERAYPINGYMYGYIDGAGFVKYKIFREVKETDIPLNNDEPNVKMGVSQGDDEPKLELSVEQCKKLCSKELRRVEEVIHVVREFIKDKG